MFSFIKNTFKKIYQQVTSQLALLFGRQTVDESTLKELEILLLSADTGAKTTTSIMTELRKEYTAGNLRKGDDLKEALKKQLNTILTSIPTQIDPDSRVYLMVGINGSGKTTFAGKLAYHYQKQGKKVLLVAADTFRAAAPEQLTEWAKKTGVSIVVGVPNCDPASVVFEGCERFKNENFDILIIDTAGRLQTKINLMNELAKIKRIINKQLPGQTSSILLTIDSMLGQNSFEQAKLFKESADVNGIILTKMDGTGKGGIVFSIAKELAIPVIYVSFGEKSDQYALFNAKNYVDELLHFESH